MTALWVDLRYAFRSFLKSPAFLAVAVLSIALGIGANTAIFTLLDQVILRLLPVKDPQNLVLLTMRGRHYGNNWGGNAISYPMYLDIQANNQVFDGMFCRFPTFLAMSFGGQTERVQSELVSGTYFPELGLTAFIGRTFTSEEDKNPGGPPLVILSYDFWKTRFAADRGILGRTMVLNGHNMTVIGVAQPGFDGVELGLTTQVFVPLMMAREMVPNLATGEDPLKNRRQRWVNGFGRLKPGVTPLQARTSLAPYFHSILEREVVEPAFSKASDQVRKEFLKCWLDLLPGSQGRASERQQLKTPLWALMAITGGVLLIACANVANLLLARAAARRKEVAVRLAMGASRARLTWQLLAESVLLSALGSAVGLVLAIACDDLLVGIYITPANAGLKISTAPDLRILAFTIAITLVTGILFGLAPAFQATRTDVAPTLKDQAGAVIGGAGAMYRKALVGAQVTLSLTLLIGAGLFVRSLQNLRDLGPGFPVQNLLVFDLNTGSVGYDAQRGKIFFKDLTEDLKTIPGVQSAGLASNRLLTGNEWDNSMTVEGYTPKQGERPYAYMNMISPGYFETMGIPVMLGRDFTVNDSQEVLHTGKDNFVPSKIMVNEKFAKTYFRGTNPIGRHVGFGIDPDTKLDMEIIGVVKDTKYTSLRDEIPQQAFMPYLANHYTFGMTVYVRSSLDSNQLMNIIRSHIRQMDPNLPVYDIRTEEGQLADSLVIERLIASLSIVFGLLATLLATIGLYGVMAYNVTRRTREIGIRMALGAIQGNVVWMVMKEVLLLVACGAALGLLAAFGLTRYVQSQLYGVTPNDPLTLVLATGLIAIVAAFSGYIPAIRASRIDPVRALRYE